MYNDSIITFKKEKKNDINECEKSLNKKIIIKSVLFFILSFIFSIFFWYYISLFGVIYKNTQYHLLEDTLMSFALSFIYPFGIYLLPGLFRIPSLSDSKKIESVYIILAKYYKYFDINYFLIKKSN